GAYVRRAGPAQRHLGVARRPPGVAAYHPPLGRDARTLPHPEMRDVEVPGGVQGDPVRLVVDLALALDREVDEDPGLPEPARAGDRERQDAIPLALRHEQFPAAGPDHDPVRE